MFYCEPCRIARDWPESIAKSFGQCEICCEPKECNDRASSTLPLPKSFPRLPGKRPLYTDDGDPIPVRPVDQIDKFLALFSDAEKASWTGKDNKVPDWVVMGVTWFLGQDPGRQELFRRLKDS